MTTLRQWLAEGTAAEIRETADFSRSALAREIGADTAAVFRWENGSRKPTGLYAAAYYHALVQLTRTQLFRDRTAARAGGSDALAC